MTHTSRTPGARRRLAVIGTAAAALALSASLATGSAAVAEPNKSPSGAANAASPARTVDVMTRNLYLGAGLDGIIDALASGNNTQIVGAATATWYTVESSDPEERMAAIADEIVAADPAVVGLQEVTTWTTYDFNPMTQTPSNPQVAYDFLDLLLDALADRGVVYHEVDGATAHNFASPPIPVLATPAATYPTQAVSLADRDVILRRDDVKAWNGHNGNFETILAPPNAPLEVDRGWGSADVRTKLATFRFVNAHTEAWGPELLRVGQVLELFAAQDAIADTDGALPMVYVGDYNSDAPNADLPGEGGYLTLRTRLDDAWIATNDTAPGYTCCQNGTLANTDSLLDGRIDLVLTGNGIDATSSHLTGTTTVELPGETRWASDHAGVVATLEVDYASAQSDSRS